MNNDEAKNALYVKMETVDNARNDVSDVFNSLRRYIEESSDWKTDVATAKMAEIKTEATAAGVDLSTWDGSSAD